jgi:hypothetical protein
MWCFALRCVKAIFLPSWCEEKLTLVNDIVVLNETVLTVETGGILALVRVFRPSTQAQQYSYNLSPEH